VLFRSASLNGGHPQFAENMGEINAHDLPIFVSHLLRLYLSNRKEAASFGVYFQNQGRADIQALLECYADIPEFEKDQSYYRDWGSDNLFSLEGKGTGECSAGLHDLIEHDLSLMRKRLEGQALYEALFYASRALLPTRGFEPKNSTEVFEGFEKHFIATGLVDQQYQMLLDVAKRREDALLSGHAVEIKSLISIVADLYAGMDNSFHFPSEAKGAPVVPAPAADLFKDYRGVACPMNFVKIKIDLSSIKTGQRLQVLLDDGAPIENVPRSVAEEGHSIIEKTRQESHWKITIQKR
jgi:sulfite reductase (ferredoxin)